MSAKMKDLSGQMFGKLTVMKPVCPDDHGHRRFECKCECGKTNIVLGSRLISGRTKSCGCLRRVLKHDLTGKKFGLLTAIRQVKKPLHRENGVFYECMCVCGTLKVVSAGDLTTGNSKSCGCSKPGKIKNLTGQKFGLLTAIRLSDKKGTHNEAVWNCKCDCGGTIDVVGTSLTQGWTRSCGCIRTRKVNTEVREGVLYIECATCGEYKAVSEFRSKKSNLLKVEFDCKACERILRKTNIALIYAQDKGSAKYRGIFFNLSKQEHEFIIKQPCSYCGKLPNPYNGIDRFDSNLGYELNNCRPCCSDCNYNKNDTPFDTWIKHNQKIIAYYETGTNLWETKLAQYKKENANG
jgi:hypothetical protein